MPVTSLLASPPLLPPLFLALLLPWFAPIAPGWFAAHPPLAAPAA